MTVKAAIKVRADSKITTSYGRVAEVNGLPTPYLYGAGYGKDAELSKCADRAAAALVRAFNLPVEKRGNSDGQSVGAHYDGEFPIGLGAFRYGDRMLDESAEWIANPLAGQVAWDASFSIRPFDRAEVRAQVPNRGGYGLDDRSHEYRARCGLEAIEVVSVYSPNFKTMREALAWLRKWGTRYCPAPGAARSQAKDGYWANNLEMRVEGCGQREVSL